MLQHTTKKLTIVAIFKCLFHVVDAKYCAFEIHGEPKYYVCPKSEYCCNFGCCVSPGFQIYHLWYYWLLVIVMFLICSGGGWWYRYWLQGRYSRATSSVLPGSNNRNYNGTVRTSVTQRPGASSTSNTLVTCQQAQHANIAYNSARNTVLLHRMWKGPHRRDQTVAYNRVASSSTHFHDTNVVLNDMNCPYYQLYGPPPSYETVIAQSRGKNFDTIISNERPRTTNRDQTLNLQYNSPILRCYAHSMQPNTHNNTSTQLTCNSYYVDNCENNCPESTSSTNNTISLVNELVRNVPVNEGSNEQCPRSTVINARKINNQLSGSLPTLCQSPIIHTSSSMTTISNNTCVAPPQLHSFSSFNSRKFSTNYFELNNAQNTSSPLQTNNPSDDNVITQSSDSNVVNNLTDDNQHQLMSSSSSINHCRNVESKRKLDRSKSLV